MATSSVIHEELFAKIRDQYKGQVTAVIPELEAMDKRQLLLSPAVYSFRILYRIYSTLFLYHTALKTKEKFIVC